MLQTQELNNAHIEILENTSELIQSIDLEGNLLYTNRAWREVFGYDESEILGRNIFDFLHYSSRQHCKSLMEKIDEAPFRNVSVSFVSKSGLRIFTTANINARCNAEGEVIGLQAFMRDITEREKAQREATIVGNQFKTLIELASDLIYQCDPYGKIIYMNPAGESILGYPLDEIIGQHFSMFIAKSQREDAASFYQEQFNHKTWSTYYEFPIVMKDGKEKWVGQNVRTIMDIYNHRIDGYLGIVRDINKRKETEDELLESKSLLEELVSERTQELVKANQELQKEVHVRTEAENNLRRAKKEYEHLFNSAHDAILVFRSKDEVILEANKKACELYGFKMREFMGMSLESLTVNVSAGKELIKITMGSRRRNVKFKTAHYNKAGDELLIEVSATPILYRGEDAILTINRDITESHLLNLELEEEREKKTSALVDGQELERKRISKEIHDGLGQMLVSLTRTMRRVENNGKLNGEQLLALDDSQKLTTEITKEAKRISMNLMPSVLLDFGLTSAVRAMLKTLEGDDVHVLFHCEKELSRLSQKVEIGLYRIVQEAVNNSLKHAFPDQLVVTLEENEDKVVLTVEDDGIGFDLKEKKKSYGNGISNMYERARLVNANIIVNTSFDKGSQVKVIYDK